MQPNYTIVFIINMCVVIDCSFDEPLIIIYCSNQLFCKINDSWRAAAAGVEFK